MFYAEQGGQFYALRLIEEHSGWLASPYSMAGMVVSLPRPPRAGKWNLFAVQTHSDMVYQNYLRDHAPKISLAHVEDQDREYGGMWTQPLVSNAITVEFAELDPDGLTTAAGVIQSLVRAGQYKPEFTEPTDDPTSPPRGPMDYGR